MVAGKAQFEREFEEVFWPQVVRKVSKSDARKAFPKAREKASLEAIMVGLQRYQQNLIAMGTEIRFFAHPATFLNGERWADEPEPIIANTGKKYHEQRHENTCNQRQSKGEEFAGIWRSISGGRQSGKEAGVHISDDFLSQTRIDAAGEEPSRHSDFPRSELAFIEPRAGIYQPFV